MQFIAMFNKRRPMTEQPSRNFAFGHCEVSPMRRQLKRDGEVIALSNPAFDILIFLAEFPGRTITKNELMARVWPGRIIEENSFEAQVSALRRALGPDREVIRTFPGRGYQFVASARSDSAAVPAPHIVLLPACGSPLIGRDTALDEIAAMTATCRLITLVGSGGIGKTKLAVEAARRIAGRFPDRVCIAELAPVAQAEFLPSTVASALGFTPADGNVSFDRIGAALSTKRVLLVLDNCEHLIDASAAIVDALLDAAPFLHVIATSREALRVEGEHLYRVASLEVPELNEIAGIHEAGDVDIDIAAVMACSAMQLFEARLGEGQAASASDARSVALKAGICRRLDGIPLAIELAAARVSAFGVAGVWERLTELFSVLTGGSQIALRRQQTLVATLDWSYQLLAPDERTVLARLSVFADQFSLDAAQLVVASTGLATAAVIACTAGLVSKSLLCSDTTRPEATYRLLDMTRAYARRKLIEHAGIQHFSKRHAEYFCARFEVAEASRKTALTLAWIAPFEAHIEDLRAAIRWSFSQDGDAGLGIKLTAAALPYWIERSLVAECLANVNQALHHVETAGECDPRTAMVLYAARGKALLYGAPHEDAARSFGRVLAIADQLDDVEYQLMALWGLWASPCVEGPYRHTVALAERFSALASAKRYQAESSVADRMLGTCYMCVGELERARDLLENMLARYRAPDSRSHLIRFAFDQRAAGLSVLAYVLYLQGFPDEARRVAESARTYADAVDHGASIWYVLTLCSCPIALLTGGIPALDGPSAAGIDAAQRCGMPAWNAQAQFWRGLISLEAHDDETYEAWVTPVLGMLGQVRHASYLAGFWSALCELLPRRGRLAEALGLITAAIDRARRAEDNASLPELLRVHGELLLLEAGDDAQARAEERFIASLEAARSMHAMSWQLRTATSLAKLWHRQGKTQAARDLLGPVYEWFTEGFGTIDLLAARDLLASLDSPVAAETVRLMRVDAR
jgi:predicted ATPase/DNA-binding winged helix-turn-helix (wHTH) protein